MWCSPINRSKVGRPVHLTRWRKSVFYFYCSHSVIETNFEQEFFQVQLDDKGFSAELLIRIRLLICAFECKAAGLLGIFFWLPDRSRTCDVRASSSPHHLFVGGPLSFLGGCGGGGFLMAASNLFCCLFLALFRLWHEGTFANCVTFLGRLLRLTHKNLNFLCSLQRSRGIFSPFNETHVNKRLPWASSFEAIFVFGDPKSF